MAWVTAGVVRQALSIERHEAIAVSSPMSVRRRFTPGIRAKVLLASSALLLIPWIGYAFVVQMERFLYDGQVRMLADNARAVATLVQERAKRVSEKREIHEIAPELTRPIELDGLVEDWIAQGADVRGYGGDRIAELHGPWTADSLSFSHAVGRYGDYIYAFFDVTDDRVVYCAPESATVCDHVRISVKRMGGELERLVLTARGPGAVAVAPVSGRTTGSISRSIEGAWRERSRGYTVELRLPAAGLEQLAFAVADVDEPAATTVNTVIVTEERGIQTGTTLEVTDDISTVLDAMARANLRIWLVDRDGVVVRRAGTIQPAATSGRMTKAVKLAVEPLESLLGSWRPQKFLDPLAQASRLETAEVAAALAGTPASRTYERTSGVTRINAASHPISIGGEIAGAVLVEQSTQSITRLREIALERLLLATLAAFVCGALILIFYVSRVSNRLRELRDEAEQAIDSVGRVRGLVTGSNAADEIGDLSRSYSAMLQRLAQYTDYLENLARRLNHELRTPIAVVRSSLDNLRSETLPQGTSVYLDRAETGLNRLSAILSRMSEATRLEEMMRRSDRETFDLNAVVSGCVEGYRVAYAPLALSYSGPGRPVHLTGVPDLIAQMLDKLVENAAEYAAAHTTVEVILEEHNVDVILRVRNQGQPLPDAMKSGLFDSMVSMRPTGSGIPHLGLGLYIVKLIAGFHQGAASAANCENPCGVEIAVRLARYVSDPA
jgi:two-component system, OmpR family, sensor histidine kinase ChvG